MAGTYIGKNLEVKVDIPMKIPPGEYYMNGNLEDAKLGHVMCLNVHLNVA